MSVFFVFMFMSKVANYINNNLSIEEEWFMVFGESMPLNKFFCPFHNNVNTPSAKKYGNGIKCFGKCQKYYTVYDFLKRFNPKRIEEVRATIIMPEESERRLNIITTVIPQEGSLLKILRAICKQS